MYILTTITRLSENITPGVTELDARRHADRVADVDCGTGWQDGCGGWSRLELQRDLKVYLRDDSESHRL